ncbi:SGNH hydrolase [Polychytrium aggregatum]|uniref:SGNH hydrolase n=1 Tax=Polychytrium aggregatum TaxID=110093 RepID=UPI0022FECB01|nr:SGNH hydrolase [Polychytrium aggregatum]KAI9205212.1 SGNH hydrolase [Polychytrium aggregatum]
MSNPDGSAIRGLGLDQFLLFGDSITQWNYDPSNHGWVASLAHKYIRLVDIVNRGFSGYNTEWCLPILPSILETTLPSQGRNKILLVVLFLGANDAAFPATHRQHVPLQQYSDNLTSMIRIVRAHHPEARILLVTPPPVFADDWEVNCVAKGRPLDRTADITFKYHTASLQVGQATGVPTLDTWKLFFGPEGRYDPVVAKSVLHDGLHFNAKGNDIFAAGIQDRIATLWPELTPEQLFKDLRLPWHDQLDVDDLPESLFRNERK